MNFFEQLLDKMKSNAKGNLANLKTNVSSASKTLGDLIDQGKKNARGNLRNAEANFERWGNEVGDFVDSAKEKAGDLQIELLRKGGDMADAGGDFLTKTIPSAYRSTRQVVARNIGDAAVGLGNLATGRFDEKDKLHLPDTPQMRELVGDEYYKPGYKNLGQEIIQDTMKGSQFIADKTGLDYLMNADFLRTPEEIKKRKNSHPTLQQILTGRTREEMPKNLDEYGAGVSDAFGVKNKFGRGAIGLGMLGLDTVFGGKGKAVEKALVEETTAKGVKDILEKEGVKASPEIYRAIAKETDPKIIRNVLEDAATGLNTFDTTRYFSDGLENTQKTRGGTWSFVGDGEIKMSGVGGNNVVKNKIIPQNPKIVSVQNPMDRFTYDKELFDELVGNDMTKWYNQVIEPIVKKRFDLGMKRYTESLQKALKDKGLETTIDTLRKADAKTVIEDLMLSDALKKQGYDALVLKGDDGVTTLFDFGTKETKPATTKTVFFGKPATINAPAGAPWDPNAVAKYRIKKGTIMPLSELKQIANAQTRKQMEKDGVFKSLSSSFQEVDKIKPVKNTDPKDVLKELGITPDTNAFSYRSSDPEQYLKNAIEDEKNRLENVIAITENTMRNADELGLHRTVKKDLHDLEVYKNKLNKIKEWEKTQQIDSSFKKAGTENLPKKTVESITEDIKKVAPEKAPEIKKVLNDIETAVEKISTRRGKDLERLGISPKEFSAALYSRAGGRMTHEQLAKLAENVPASIHDLINKPLRAFPNDVVKIEAYGQEVQGFMDNVVEKLKIEHMAHPNDKTVLENYMKAKKMLFDAHTKLEAIRRESGRIVSASRIYGFNSRIPGMNKKILQVRDSVKRAAEKAGRPEDIAEFDMALKNIDLDDASKTLNFLTEWNKPTALQKLMEIRKAMMLSALSTQATNALGNLSQQLLDIPVRGLAGVLDYGRHKITGAPRTVFSGEAGQLIKGTVKNTPDAIKKAARAIMDEHYPQSLQRTEIEAGLPVPAIKGNIGKAIRFLSFRMLGAGDMLFRTTKKGAELEAAAYRLAKKEGLKGKALKERIAEFIDTPKSEWLDLVDERVERSLMLEELTGALKSIEKLKNDHPILQVPLPFYRTLVNLTREAYRLTPIGGVGRTTGKLMQKAGMKKAGRTIEDLFHNKWTRNPETQMEELSRQILGTSFMIWAINSMLSGDLKINGSAPKNRGEKEIFYGTGKLPFSVQYGDGKSIQLSRIQPIGDLLGVVGGIGDIIKAQQNKSELDNKAVERATRKALADSMRLFTEQPIAKGIRDFFDAATGGKYEEGVDNSMTNYMGQVVASFIPNVMTRASRVKDDQMYVKTGFMDQIKDKLGLFGANKGLAKRRTVFGEPVKYEGSALQRFAGPINMTEKDPQDPDYQILKEFERVGYKPPVPSRKMYNTKHGYPVELTPKEYEFLQLDAGPKLREAYYKLINDPMYQNENKYVKEVLLRRVGDAIMKESKAALFPTYTARNNAKKAYETEGMSPLEAQRRAEQDYPIKSRDYVEALAQALYEERLKSGQAKPTIESILNNRK